VLTEVATPGEVGKRSFISTIRPTVHTCDQALRALTIFPGSTCHITRKHARNAHGHIYGRTVDKSLKITRDGLLWYEARMGSTLFAFILSCALSI